MRHLLSHPPLGILDQLLAGLKMHVFVSSQLSWLKSF